MKKTKFTLLLISMIFIEVLDTNAQSKYTENKYITSIINKKKEYNKNNGTGYRIQLYNGLENKAKSLCSKFRAEYPGVYTKIKYDQPDWKAQVGDYRTRLQADKALNKIREKFNGAIVIPL
ncbi:SPOR domain-containing protein [Tenacibaculum aestuariivivum]|uniref:SPOR domain-containing protein n=1 Tax=Tenacibaculum aestuariivivum TaxID=2006131 RepID=UPI003AB7B493